MKCTFFYLFSASVLLLTTSAFANSNITGKVVVLKDEKKIIVADTKKTQSKFRDGKTIYEAHCIICHEAGVAGAPKFQSVDDWKPRLDKGMDTIIGTVKQGMNAMPVMGTCTDCKDEEIKAAIEYMSKP